MASVTYNKSSHVQVEICIPKNKRVPPGLVIFHILLSHWRLFYSPICLLCLLKLLASLAPSVEQHCSFYVSTALVHPLCIYYMTVISTSDCLLSILCTAVTVCILTNVRAHSHAHSCLCLHMCVLACRSVPTWLG